MTTNNSAEVEFAEWCRRFDSTLARIVMARAKHFGCEPATVNWTAVDRVTKVVRDLERIAESINTDKR